MKSSVLFEVLSFEVGSFEVGSFEVGSFEVGSYDVGSFEVQSVNHDFDHCDILSTPCETSQKASRWSPVTCDRTSTFRLRAKVDVLSQAR